MTSAQVLPAVVVPLVIWRVYARIRRNIGRQPYRPKRLRGTAIFFALLALLAAAGAFRAPTALAALGAGIALAVPLGWWALRTTKWENSAAGEFYTPNSAIGLIVTLLFVGRIVYRVVAVTGIGGAGDVSPASFQNPLTLLIYGVTAGYYVIYYFGLYSRGKRELAAAAAK
jgi:hypothetical protein